MIRFTFLHTLNTEVAMGSIRKLHLGDRVTHIPTDRKGAIVYGGEYWNCGRKWVLFDGESDPIEIILAELERSARVIHYGALAEPSRIRHAGTAGDF